jgi:hypothetical protein
MIATGSTALVIELEAAKKENARMRAALQNILQMQGKTIPGWNDEFIPYQWAQEEAKRGLGLLGPTQ